MVQIEEIRKKQILDKRLQLDTKVEHTQKKRENEHKFKKELEKLKREDRQETVERINKIQ